MGERKPEMKYALTPELREYIRRIRQYFVISAEEMADSLGMNKETYNNIEKMSSRTTMITRDLFERIFAEFQKHSPNEQNWSLETYIKGHLEKFLYNTDTKKETLENQHWLKALHLKYDIVFLNENSRNALLPYNYEELAEMLHNLSKNRHIKLKTDIILENEVYINLNEKKYPNFGGYPFWCVKYGDFTEREIDKIISDIDNGTIPYTLLFSLLINEELKSRRQKDYNDIFATVYNKLSFYHYNNIFDIINKIVAPKTNTVQNATEEKADTFLSMLEELDITDYTESTKQLITNCLDGGDNFINSINVDFSPLYNASVYDIEVFKIRLREILDTLK